MFHSTQRKRLEQDLDHSELALYYSMVCLEKYE